MAPFAFFKVGTNSRPRAQQLVAQHPNCAVATTDLAMKAHDLARELERTLAYVSGIWTSHDPSFPTSHFPLPTSAYFPKCGMWCSPSAIATFFISQ